MLTPVEIDFVHIAKGDHEILGHSDAPKFVEDW